MITCRRARAWAYWRALKRRDTKRPVRHGWLWSGTPASYVGQYALLPVGHDSSAGFSIAWLETSSDTAGAGEGDLQAVPGSSRIQVLPACQNDTGLLRFLPCKNT
jgi:hypothetical protein